MEIVQNNILRARQKKIILKSNFKFVLDPNWCNFVTTVAVVNWALNNICKKPSDQPQILLKCFSTLHVYNTSVEETLRIQLKPYSVQLSQ